MNNASLADLVAAIAERLGGSWLVVGPDGSSFQDVTPHRAANAANRHRARLISDWQQAARLRKVIQDNLASAQAENDRLLARYGSLNCPTCGGSGHIGDADSALALPQKPADAA